MPKYDAFGREIGEDTLAGWRQQEAPVERDDEAATPFGDAEPAVTPAADAPPPVTDGDPAAAGGGQTFTVGDATVTIGEPIVIQAEPVQPPPGAAGGARPAAAPDPERVIRVQMPRARRRPRVVSRLIVLLVVLGIAGTFVINVGREVEDAIRDVPGFTPPAPETAAPVGLQAGSLIRPGELRRALAQLRARQLGRVQTMRLAPERIDAAFVSRGGVLQAAQLRHDGAFQAFSSTPNSGHLETIPWGRLNAAAPARLVRQAARRLKRSTNQINYLVPSLIDGKVIWGAYFKGGQIFQGDARGRVFRRIS